MKKEFKELKELVEKYYGAVFGRTYAHYVKDKGLVIEIHNFDPGITGNRKLNRWSSQRIYPRPPRKPVTIQKVLLDGRGKFSMYLIDHQMDYEVTLEEYGNFALRVFKLDLTEIEHPKVEVSKDYAFEEIDDERTYFKEEC